MRVTICSKTIFTKIFRDLTHIIASGRWLEESVARHGLTGSNQGWQLSALCPFRSGQQLMLRGRIKNSASHNVFPQYPLAANNRCLFVCFYTSGFYNIQWRWGLGLLHMPCYSSTNLQSLWPHLRDKKYLHVCCKHLVLRTQQTQLGKNPKYDHWQYFHTFSKRPEKKVLETPWSTTDF